MGIKTYWNNKKIQKKGYYNKRSSCFFKKKLSLDLAL